MKRRDFIKKSITASTAAVSAPLILGGIPVRAATHLMHDESLFASTDNILVVIQLFGGNDGLNTFVPFENALYYNSRPTLAIPKQQVLKINNPTMGLHPVMTGFKSLFDTGKLAIIQGVGYENSNRSHFRSTDIILTGSGAGAFLDTGWAGRYLEYQFPTFPLQLPDDPFAVQIGGTLSLMLQSDKGGMGISLLDPDEFYRNGSSNPVNDDVIPGTPFGDEYIYVKAIKQQSDKYASVVKNAFDRGKNNATYSSVSFSQQLRLVARLISGGLQSRMYMVYLGGFDTHVNQFGVHQNLVKNLSDAVLAFETDLKIEGTSPRVVGMTISEFGRRTNENGSQGTDHGAASVQFMFGDKVNSGVLGPDPDLVKTDSSGDVLYTFDYRQVYSDVLEHWFKVPKDDVTNILGGRFIPLPLLQTGTNVYERSPNEFFLAQNYPNPFGEGSGAAGRTTMISFQFDESMHARVNLQIFDAQGKLISTLVDRTLSGGTHNIPFDAATLQSGMYLYRLRIGAREQVKKMMIIR